MSKGFIIKVVGDDQKLNKKDRKDLKKILVEINDEQIDNITGDDDIKEENKIYYDVIKKLCEEILHIDIKDAAEYRDIIFDDKELRHHFNLSKMFMHCN